MQAAADAAGVGNARYNTVGDLLVHPQLTGRTRVVEVASPVGPLAVVRSAVMSGDWDEPAGPIPAVGEHTAAIYRWLGLGSAAAPRDPTGPAGPAPG